MNQLSFVEIFNSQSKQNSVKLNGKIVKEFDDFSKAYVYSISQSKPSNFQFPSNPESGSLKLTNEYLIIQLLLNSISVFCIEIVIRDSKAGKKRLIFSSSTKEVSVSFIHSKLPIIVNNIGSWMNLCVNIQDFVSKCLQLQSFLYIDSINLCFDGKLRRVVSATKLEMSSDFSIVIPKSLSISHSVNCEVILFDYSYIMDNCCKSKLCTTNNFGQLKTTGNLKKASEGKLQLNKKTSILLEDSQDSKEPSANMTRKRSKQPLSKGSGIQNYMFSPCKDKIEATNETNVIKRPLSNNKFFGKNVISNTTAAAGNKKNSMNLNSDASTTNINKKRSVSKPKLVKQAVSQNTKVISPMTKHSFKSENMVKGNANPQKNQSPFLHIRDQPNEYKINYRLQLSNGASSNSSKINLTKDNSQVTSIHFEDSKLKPPSNSGEETKEANKTELADETNVTNFSKKLNNFNFANIYNTSNELKDSINRLDESEISVKESIFRDPLINNNRFYEDMIDLKNFDVRSTKKFHSSKENLLITTKISSKDKDIEMIKTGDTSLNCLSPLINLQSPELLSIKEDEFEDYKKGMLESGSKIAKSDSCNRTRTKDEYFSQILTDDYVRINRDIQYSPPLD